jgi:GT2 family glycosyltransferase
MLGYPFCRGRILDRVERDIGQYNNIEDIFWASGACMFIRASAYQNAGGLDGDFFAHMEEIDLCWRLKRLGYAIKVIPRSVIFHVGGGTLPNNNPHKLYLNYRNNLYLLFKNLKTSRIVPILLTRMFLDGLSAIVYLVTGSGNYFMSVLKAHIAFERNIPRLIKKRRMFRKTTEIVRIKEIYRGSILFDYFFRKKRNFNQIHF